MPVRLFNAEDASAWVALTNPVLLRNTSPERLLEEDVRLTPFNRRWVFEQDGAVLGVARLNFSPFLRPEYLQASVVVTPSRRRLGIGQTLWQTVIAAVPRDIQGLSADVLDTDPVSLSWVERRGFVPQAHRFASELDLTTFDDAPFRTALNEVQAQGIRITDLQDVDDQTVERYINLIAELLMHTPDLAGQPRWTADQVRETFHMNSDPHPEWQLLAIGPDGEWLGLTVMVRYGTLAYNEFTAVIPQARGRGLALPLKLQVIRRAQEAGLITMRTNNHSQNIPMLAVNRKLGFVQQPGKFELHLTLNHAALASK